MRSLHLISVLLAFTLQLRSQSILSIGATTVTVDTLYTGLDVPWEIVYGADGKIWMTERKGIVSTIDPVTKTKTTVLNLTGSIYYYGEAGLLGLTFHPDFSNNKLVYLVYNFGVSLNVWERLVRYTYTNGSLVNPQIVLDSLRGNSNHNGSRLLFMPDHTLLMTTGEAGDTSLAQKMNSLNGKVLRMNADGSVPADNPFAGSLIYTLGHRNPQGLAMGPNGNFYVTEHGPTTDDEFQVVEKGKNYGWPRVEGYCDLPPEISYCSTHAVKEPLLNWTPTLAPSDLVYYSNNSFPEFNNRFLMCTLKAKKLVAVALDASGTSSLSAIPYLDLMFGRLRDICVGPSQEIYLATNGADPANIDPGTHSIIVLRPPLPVIGINEITSKPAFRVYPTVAEDLLNVEVEDASALLFDLELRDICGKLCMKDSFSQVYCSSLSNLEPGIYYLGLGCEGQIVYRTRIILLK